MLVETYLILAGVGIQQLGQEVSAGEIFAQAQALARRTRGRTLQLPWWVRLTHAAFSNCARLKVHTCRPVTCNDVSRYHTTAHNHQ